MDGVKPGPARVVGCGGLLFGVVVSGGWVAVAVLAIGREGDDDDDDAETFGVYCCGISVDTALVLFP